MSKCFHYYTPSEYCVHCDGPPELINGRCARDYSMPRDVIDELRAAVER